MKDLHRAKAGTESYKAESLLVPEAVQGRELTTFSPCLTSGFCPSHVAVYFMNQPQPLSNSRAPPAESGGLQGQGLTGDPRLQQSGEMPPSWSAEGHRH